MILGKYLLDNYIISPSTRYENHTLIYTAADSDPIELRGILAAAILAASSPKPPLKVFPAQRLYVGMMSGKQSA